MKGIIRILFGVVALTTFCGTVSAQTGKQRFTREQLAEVQAKHIAKEMAMDDATSQRFIDTFCQFQRDIWALGPRLKHPNDQMTDEETEQALKARFAHSQKAPCIFPYIKSLSEKLPEGNRLLSKFPICPPDIQPCFTRF